MNLPNKLTMMRVVSGTGVYGVCRTGRYGTADFNATFSLVAGIIFTVASITDFGRLYCPEKHLVTDFGKFMDPLADKCLTTAAFIYMVVDGVCSPIVLAVILFREFAVAGVRMIAAETGTVIAANMWGKVKTVLQMLTIIFYYFCRCAGRAYRCGRGQSGDRGAVLAVRRGHAAVRLHLPVAEPPAVYAGEVIPLLLQGRMLASTPTIGSG